MKETMISATPMGFAGRTMEVEVKQVIPEGGSTAPEIVEFPLTDEAFRRFQEAAELPSESWLEDNLNLHVREAEYHAKRAREAREKLPRLRRKARHYRNAVLSYMVGWGLVGFVLGIVGAVSQMLQVHGPTVTIRGTIVAMGIYVVVGLAFGALFAWLGREHATSMADDYACQVSQQKEIVNECEAERLYHLRQAEEFDSALHKRQFAWLFGTEI